MLAVFLLKEMWIWGSSEWLQMSIKKESSMTLHGLEKTGGGTPRSTELHFYGIWYLTSSNESRKRCSASLSKVFEGSLNDFGMIHNRSEVSIVGWEHRVSV